MASLVLISINSPLIAGLYENNTLTKHYEIQGHTSAALNSLFGDIFASNAIIDSIFYAKGPGRLKDTRFLALKVFILMIMHLSTLLGKIISHKKMVKSCLRARAIAMFLSRKMDFVCQQCLIHKILIGKMNHFIFCHLCDCRGSVC